MPTVRRVRRIVRRIDPWTVFKVSSIFSFVTALAVVLGLVMFWSVVQAAEIPAKITDILVKITLLEEGADPFGSDEYFLRLAVYGSIVGAVLATGFATLGAIMYNLIADVVGGIEFVVLEETLQPVPGTRLVAPAPPVTNNALIEAPTEEHPVSARVGD